MKLILIIAAVVQILSASEEWQWFKTKYDKLYKTEEEQVREKIFLDRLKLVEEHNKEYEKGLVSYKLQINKYADLTNEEMFSVPNEISSREEVPDGIDWRDYGAISPIADQMGCETCWAFATVATIEAHWAIYKGENITLSQQNLADCVDPTFRCSTDMKPDIFDKTYQYITDNGGIDTLESYPYESYAEGSCRFSSDNIGATIKGYANITEGDEEELKKVVGTIGPVTVAITTNTYWSLYAGGVFYQEDCMDSDRPFNHAVVVVGYGTEDGQDYWLVKNSWGTWFGEKGYIKMARNRDNNCGIASIARYPLI